MPPESQIALVVLGMHRSGTSALAGLLNLLGASAGDNLISAVPAVNSRGFWEHAGVVDLHERLLSKLGFTWHDERNMPANWWCKPEIDQFREELTNIVRTDFASEETWLVKDPRMCRLMPLWRPIFDASPGVARVVIILRDPREVVQSLARRDGISGERANLLWFQHVLEAEKWTRNYQRAFVTFEKLLEDWRSTVEEISAKLSVHFCSTDHGIQRRAEAFLEPALRHHRSLELTSGPIGDLALRAYHACLEVSEPYQLEAALRPFGTRVSEMADTVAGWSHEIQAISRAQLEIAAYRAAAEASGREVARIKGSFSWRVTAPLRVAWNLGLKMFGRNPPVERI